MRKTVYTFMALVVAASLCLGCVDKQKVKEKIAAQEAALLHRTQTAEPVPVRVLTVSNEAVGTSASYVGKVEPSKNAIILNQFPGTVEEINAVRGRKISKGSVIARINSETVKSAYDIAKATLEQAEDGFKRAEQVYGSGAVTEVKMVEIRTRLEQARAAEKSARQALEDCEIKAPFTGVVNEVYVQKGENVGAAAPLVQMMDVESVEIHFSVPESEYADIAIGEKAEVEIPALHRTVSGTVAVKGIAASALSHAYDFTLKGISDTYQLMPGMVCKVRIQAEGDEMMVVPASAVMTDMEGRYIWGVTDDGTVCKTYVTVGGYAGKGIVITEGLEEGDRVIVDGSRKVSTGMKVKTEE
ncbi:MAG: efflux RND transporter periplasmic adaptor subunit [Bacteroidia bacterium]|nr:efflux RND transporter periplasmic adaptor subunit [Bacteroidia bacterium]